MEDKKFQYIKFDASQIMIDPYPVIPIESYEEPENFPNCCNWHKSIVDLSIQFYDKFPNCCEKHKNLINTFKIDKSKYENVKIEIVRKISYTMHFLEHKINNDDWYEDTLHWFDYVENSFGQPEVGLNVYLDNITYSIKNSKIIPNNKKIILKKYFDQLNKPITKVENSDFTILMEIYHTWLKLFPFELTVFKNLKAHFERKIPVAKEKPDFNPYTGFSKFKPVSQIELIENLINTTNSILSKVDTSVMVEKNLNDQANIHNLEILNKLHRTKQETLLKEFSKSETKYIKTIKKWLQNEKEYFSSVVPIINQKVLPQATKVETIKAFKLKGLQTTIKDKAIDLHNSLVTKQYLNEECKKDFIKLFTGTQAENKISWLGQKGELKSFIDFLLSLGKIENCQSNKWTIAAANFKFLNDDFNANTIKDTKKAKNDINIKQIVQSGYANKKWSLS
jgi:hypothetical protein